MMYKQFFYNTMYFVVVFITLKLKFFYTKNIHYSSNAFHRHNLKLKQTVILVVFREDLFCISLQYNSKILVTWNLRAAVEMKFMWHVLLSETADTIQHHESHAWSSMCSTSRLFSNTSIHLGWIFKITQKDHH